MFTDSHTHLYLEAFEADREEMVQRALQRGVTRMLLPNIDSSSMGPLFSMVKQFPNHCFPMMGLHPTSVKEDYRGELERIEAGLKEEGIVAIGETGIDLYWDQTFRQQQEEVFAIQIGWAMKLDLPIVIHARDSFQEIFRVLDSAGGPNLRGVFHSFTGGPSELERALSYNFMIGINGIVTFRNSNLEEVVRAIPANRLLLETDAPFLAPVPYRGQRNESSYLVEIAMKVAKIHNLTIEDVATVTSINSEHLFRLKPQNEI